jgi:gamma-glutamylputrescine oxidase
MILSEPVWAHPHRQPYPRIAGGRVRADVAVIGGGLTGLSAAYHLLGRRPGARVVVLEARHIGAGASGHATGILGPGVGQSFASLVRRQGRQRARALYLATLGAVDEVRRIIAEEAIDCELEMTGQLIVGLTPSGRRRLGINARLMSELDLPVELLDDAALDRSIRLERRRVAEGPAGLRVRTAGTLNPRKLLLGLADRVVARSGSIYEGSDVTSVHGRQPLRLEIAAGGEVVADEVVVATAGYTPKLGLFRGRMLPVHLQVIVTDPLSRKDRATLAWAGREPVVDSRRIFSYFRLTGDDRVVFGGGAPRYEWAGSTSEGGGGSAALDRLAIELRAVFPQELAVGVSGGWTGLIGYVLDALPAIARSRDRPALLHAIGWCGHGLALSVASGAWIAHMLCDGAVREDLPWFRHDPPLVPSEALRWAGFHASVGAMKLLDRVGL